MMRAQNLLLLLCITSSPLWSFGRQALSQESGAPAITAPGDRQPHLALDPLQIGDAPPSYLVVAAYPAWRAPAFPPENIPFKYLDEIDHCFVRPGVHGTLIVPNGFVEPGLIQLAHREATTVFLGVGGARSYDAFAAMASDADDRAAFVQNLTAFVADQGYDGVNIDWEFPQTPADRLNLTTFMAELRAGLDTIDPSLQLSLAVTSNEKRGQWIDVEAISPLVHHFLVMTFGYYGAWGSESGHNAPLYPAPHASDTRSVNQSLRYWTETRGVPPAKILMGMPAFGLWFDSEGLGQPFTASEQADYRDIQSLPGSGYTRLWDGVAQVPYLTADNGPGVWSYDDPQSTGEKCDYVIANALGGVAVWDLTMDQVDGDHELLRVIADRLAPASYDVYLPSLRQGERFPSPEIKERS